MSEDLSLWETRGEVSVQWRINDFISLPKEVDFCLDSPFFLLSDAKWSLSICPNGESESDEFVSLYLRRECSTSPKHKVAFTLGIRKQDGSDYLTRDLEYEFLENDGYGWDDFIEISKLRNEKNAVLEEGSLTLFCTALVNTTTHSNEKAVENGSLTSSQKNGNPTSSVQILQQSFKDLLISGREGDVIFKVQDEQFQAHRLILSARSPVLLEMLSHDTEEKKTGIVNIDDFSVEAFKKFLQFIYTGDLDVISSSNVVELYKAADKYELNDLRNECEQHMTAKLNCEIFCDVALLASFHNELKLLETATEFFIKNNKTILPTFKWQSFMKERTTLANELLMKMANKK